MQHDEIIIIKKIRNFMFASITIVFSDWVEEFINKHYFFLFFSSSDLYLKL